MSRVVHVLVGPPEHGVNRWARAIATHLRADIVVAATAETVDDDRACAGDAVHVHFTDRLFGSDAPDGAARCLAMLARWQVPVAVTLHDLPQPSDGAGFGRRVDAYRRVASAVSTVIVSSRHERSLWGEAVGGHVEVVPLAVTVPDPIRPLLAVGTDVAVLGYVYPGKGHAEVLSAMSVLDDRFGLLAVGAPAPGHDDLVADLRRRADAAGRRFAITGFVPDADRDALLASVAIPVAHHRHLSASGSIPDWVAAGRRPLLPRGRYTEEFADRSPGTVTLYDDTPAALSTALAAAAAAPASTWLAADAVAHPSWAEVAAAHRSVYRQLTDTRR